MKKIFLIAAFTGLSGFANAQMTSVDDEVAQNLLLAITLKGFECAQVVNVVPIGTEGAKITCIKTAGNDATGIYIFGVSADGLSITEE